MPSIRTRITATYAIAIAGTMFAFSVAVWFERNQVARQDLINRASTAAELAARILQQAGVESEQVTITTDSVVGSQLSPRFRAYLEALPDYLIVADSGRVIYASLAVRQLGANDSTALAGAANLLKLQQVAYITLSGVEDQLLIAGRLNVPRARGGVRRVVAGVSTSPLSIARSQVLILALIALPLILFVSIGTAWLLTGRVLQPIDRMVNDVEAITDGRSLHRRIPVEELGDEIGRLGETLNAMIGRLESSFAALRRFTADASHELKTPLTVLRADIERAMTAPQQGTEQLVALEEALAETTRMAALVEALLTLARADEGRFDIHREPVRLELLARDVGETANILGEDAGITVQMPLIQPVTVLGDPVRLRQLFLNLVENAVKYTPKGGTVELSLESKEGSALFTVADTGIGIAGADLPFIFDRFWRVDRARSRTERSGVGLGLAISQWIAQAHGGSITVAARLGRGSTFTVTIPEAPLATDA